MQKLFVLMVAAFIVYALFSDIPLEQGDGKQAPDIVTNIKSAGRKVKNAGASVLYGAPENDKTNDKASGGVIEAYLARTMQKALSTEEGKEFLKQIITVDPAALMMADFEERASDDGDKRETAKKLFSIRTINYGHGNKVDCGYVVRVQYNITGNSIAVERDEIQYQLGSAKVLPALDSIITGMRIGESREAKIPARLKANQGENVGNDIVRVTLHSAIPSFFINEEEVRLFVKAPNSGRACLCGDTVEFDAKITKFDGTVIFDSKADHKRVKMTIGDMFYPMIFSHILFDQIPSTSAVVITKGKYFNAVGAQNMNKLLTAPINKEEFYLLELDNLTLLHAIVPSL